MRYRSLSLFNSAFSRTVRNVGTHSDSKYVNKALSGKENFENDFKKNYIETTTFQKIVLGIGSGIISITNPTRADMVALMGEVTGTAALRDIRNKMLESKEGQRILEEKPRISSASIDLEKLKSYPEGSMGKAYSNFLEKYGYSPDERNAVRFVDDIELAYVAQRYREIHDLLHTVFDMPTNMLGEVTVKWVEAIQTKLPMCITGALFGPVRLAPKFTRSYSTKITLRMDSELSDKIEKNKIKAKHHPGVMHIKCCEVPSIVKKRIPLCLERVNKKELLEEALKFERHLLKRMVPLEYPEIRKLKKSIASKLREQRCIPTVNDYDDDDNDVNVDSDYNYDYEYDNPDLTDITSYEIERRLKFLKYNWKPVEYDKNLCLQYLVLRAPAEYAAVKRVFNEIAKRDPDFHPTGLFDFGSGVGTVVWAANEFWGNTIKQYYCVDSSYDMVNLATLILGTRNIDHNAIINTVYHRNFMPMSYNPHDIVVSAFSLFELSSCEERMKLLTVLWNNTQKYLVLLEYGSNAGFKLINEARSYLIEVSRENKVGCHVFAPCPHELDCPRLTVPGKRTPCNFSVKYLHLPVSKLRHNIGVQYFCFLVLKKEDPPPEEERQSRIVRSILRRHRHVVCHLCTNKGELNTVTVTKSKHGKPTYKCMKHSKWGDLIPPGIKVEEKEVIDHKELISDEDTDASSDSDSGEDDLADSNRDGGIDSDLEENASSKKDVNADIKNNPGS